MLIANPFFEFIYDSLLPFLTKSFLLPFVYLWPKFIQSNKYHKIIFFIPVYEGPSHRNYSSEPILIIILRKCISLLISYSISGISYVFDKFMPLIVLYFNCNATLISDGIFEHISIAFWVAIFKNLWLWLYFESHDFLYGQGLFG